MSAVCESNGEEVVDDKISSEIDEEVKATEKVINAFLYYKKYGQEKVLIMLKQMKNIPDEHQKKIGESFKNHIKSLNERVEHNYSVLRQVVNFGAGVFGEESMKALRIHQLRRPSSDYASKVLSTMRQICREWSKEGEVERIATYQPIIDELNKIYPNETTKREEIRVLVPGCGLGRLAYDLVSEGFTVQGNEFSLFMLITSCFILNACKKENQFTIYPFLFDKSNCWKYEDQLRPVSFPDKCPTGNLETRINSFSMSGGDFLDVTAEGTFDVIITAWFIDTAHNILEYIDRIYESLEENGTWINVGPLTYHFEDVKDESSIELPYSEIMRIIQEKGFKITKEMKIDSKYTVNRLSMLQNQFTCAFFTARK